LIFQSLLVAFFIFTPEEFAVMNDSRFPAHFQAASPRIVVLGGDD
jgi:hypothetical protein